MSVKKYNPLTPGRRTMTSQDFSMITEKTPKKSLVRGKKENAGRSSNGKISVRHQGGGAKKKFRLVNFKRLNEDKALIVGIEYDPNRSARIARIEYTDKKQDYIIAPHNAKVGQVITIGEKGSIETGNRLALKNIPIGTSIYEIEIQPRSNAKMVRSAGSVASLLAIEGKYAMVKLPSGEIRQFLANSKATIGQVSNIHHNQIVIGKAGRKRLMGIRPTVRGKAMYPAAHPHGGGEGNTPIGMAPKTKWGAKALGVKTRKINLQGEKLIIRKRKKRR